MLTPHFCWKPGTLNGNGLGEKNIDVFEFKKIKVEVAV
jgi:hypothetical protein